MARVFQMSWIAKTATWMKEYKKRKYAVSCRQLGAPPTKEGSYRQANDWWARKKAEIDGYTLTPAPPTPGTPEAFHRILEAWAGASVETPEEAWEVIQHLVDNFHTVRDKQTLQTFIHGPDRLAQLQQEAGLVFDSPAVPVEKSVGAQVDRWVATQQAQVGAGNLTPDRADNNRIALYHFRDWCGPMAVEQIDAARLHGFYLWCLAKVEERQNDPTHKAGWGGEYAKKVFATARTITRFLWESGLIELPRNIDSKAWRFGNGAKAVPTWTVKEVQRVVREAPGQLRLHLLLMLNCGFTQTDVSDLLDSEVDWEDGTITKERSKTVAHENVPVVQYRLWRLTFDLLKKYRSGGERVLMTESGRPFVRKELVRGRLVKADGIASNYAHLKRRLRFRKPLKQLRKTVATMLDSHPVYGRLTSLFLGHAPRSVKDRNYAAPPQELFDEAVRWLGEQLGQVPTP
jgi:integrase